MMILQVLAVVATFISGVVAGAAHEQARFEQQKAKDAAVIAARAVENAAITEQIAENSIVQQAETAEATKTIIKEVKVYVPRDTPCRIPDGYVRLLDRSAAGDLHVSAATSRADAATAGTEDARAGNDGDSELQLTDAASVTALNYGICRQNAEQLAALQGWIKAMQETAAK